MHRYYFLNIKANIIVNSAYSAVKFIAFHYLSHELVDILW